VIRQMSKLIVVPVLKGKVVFATDSHVTIYDSHVHKRLDCERSQIVGRQPESKEEVLVIEVDALLAALEAAGNELVEVEINGRVERLTAKAAYLDVPRVGLTTIPLRYFDEVPEVMDFIRTVRIPRRIADDRGL